jgi:predicted amidohydrolase YtcJ
VGETLAGYTSAAATAGGWETELGRIAVGMRADLTAVDDVRDEDADAWSADRVRLTVVDGRVVHDAL